MENQEERLKEKLQLTYYQLQKKKEWLQERERLAEGLPFHPEWEPLLRSLDHQIDQAEEWDDARVNTLHNDYLSLYLASHPEAVDAYQRFKNTLESLDAQGVTSRAHLHLLSNALHLLEGLASIRRHMRFLDYIFRVSPNTQISQHLKALEHLTQGAPPFEALVHLSRTRWSFRSLDKQVALLLPHIHREHARVQQTLTAIVQQQQDTEKAFDSWLWISPL